MAAPKNWWLGDDFPFQIAYVQVQTVSFREGIFPSQKKTDLIRCLLLVANLRNPKAASSEGWDQKSGVPQKHEGFSLISLGVSVGTCFHEHYELLKNRDLPCRSAHYLMLIIYYAYIYKSCEKTHQPQLLSTISWFKEKHGEGINPTNFTPNPRCITTKQRLPQRPVFAVRSDTLNFIRVMIKGMDTSVPYETTLQVSMEGFE